MNAKAIETLLILSQRPRTIKDLARSIGVSYVRANQIARELW